MRVLRYEVPIDDKIHKMDVSGGIIQVAANDLYHAVEFWAEENGFFPAYTGYFRVFGTGHEIPDGSVVVGTTQRTEQGHVWHLAELFGINEDEEDVVID